MTTAQQQIKDSLGDGLDKMKKLSSMRKLLDLPHGKFVLYISEDWCISLSDAITVAQGVDIYDKYFG